MDRVQPKAILLAALGLVGGCLFAVIAFGAAVMAAFAYSGAPHVAGRDPVMAVAFALVAVLFVWFTYFSLRAAMRRIRQARASD